MLPDLSISLSLPRHQFYGTLLCLNQSSYPESALLLSVYVSTTRSAQPFSTNPLDSFPTHLDPLLSRKSFFSFFANGTLNHLFRFKLTPETAWGTLHGLVGLGMVVWWQGTVHLAAMTRSIIQQK